MAVLRNILFVAALSGLAAGVVMTALQFFFTVPLIVAAESFEAAPAHDHDATVAPHDHDAQDWAPADGFDRMFYTALANLVAAVGFGLVLVAVSEFAGGIAGWRQGVIWGLAAFAAFTLAPGLGLPPELPAMPAAELGPRQAWWIGCVIATASGLALIAFGRSPGLAVLGAALLVLPHLVGAPRPESHDSPVPADLHHSFVVAVTVTGLVFWLALGALVGLIRPRFAAALGTQRQRLA